MQVQNTLSYMQFTILFFYSLYYVFQKGSSLDQLSLFESNAYPAEFLCNIFRRNFLHSYSVCVFVIILFTIYFKCFLLKLKTVRIILFSNQVFLLDFPNIIIYLPHLFINIINLTLYSVL